MLKSKGKQVSFRSKIQALSQKAQRTGATVNAMELHCTEVQLSGNTREKVTQKAIDMCIFMHFVTSYNRTDAIIVQKKLHCTKPVCRWYLKGIVH